MAARKVTPNLGLEGQLEFEFLSDGHYWTIHVVDERPDVDIDPTLNIYRGNEEEPIVTVHLNPDAPCDDHVVAPREMCGASFMAGAYCVLPKGHSSPHASGE